MFNPLPPPAPDQPERPETEEAEDTRRSEPDFRRRRKHIDIRHKQYQNGDEETELTGLDWVLAVACSVIGCVVGIVYLSQGKPKAGKMIGISVVCSVLWSIVRALALNSMREPGFVP